MCRQPCRRLALAALLAVLPLSALAQADGPPTYAPPPIPNPVPSPATPAPFPPSLYPGFQAPNTTPPNVLTAPQTLPPVDRAALCAAILDANGRARCLERAGQD